ERQDEETVKGLLVTASGPPAGGMDNGTGNAGLPAMMGGSAASTPGPGSGSDLHRTPPEHAPVGQPPPQVPLSMVADVRIVEGPATIRSENGQLMNYVTLNVRGRDMVGFVEEAQRVVREKVTLPEGVHVEWSGQFEHQIRAANTLRFIFPAVIVLIFV